MPRLDFEKTVSVKLLHRDGGELFSAIFERDPRFLHWNRISLIGTYRDYQRFLPISRGQLEWELYDNPEWPAPAGNRPEHRTFGLAILHSSRRAGGSSIARDSVQKFADFAIRKHVETSAITDGKLSAIYAFLQRPHAWYVYPKHGIDSLCLRGEWRCVPPLGLKLRLLTNRHRRDDSRNSQEIELIEIPGLEIKPIGEMSTATFLTAADKLWFSIRVLLIFRLRQAVIPLFEQVCTPDNATRVWRRVEVELRQEPQVFDDVDFFGRLDDFLAEAAEGFGRFYNHRHLLHSAAMSYAASFDASVLEAQLTDRIEAIEQLVTVYEKSSGLERGRFNREQWKPIKQALKETVDDLEVDKEVADHLKRGLASPPVLTLQERIERMANAYSDEWNSREQALLDGLKYTIAARNTIVHGRLIDDIDRLAVEGLRAQVIFEKLFSNFIGCDKYCSSAYLLNSISSLERRLAGIGDE